MLKTLSKYIVWQTYMKVDNDQGKHKNQWLIFRYESKFPYMHRHKMKDEVFCWPTKKDLNKSRL